MTTLTLIIKTDKKGNPYVATQKIYLNDDDRNNKEVELINKIKDHVEVLCQSKKSKSTY